MNVAEKKISKKVKELRTLEKKIIKLKSELTILEIRIGIKRESINNLTDAYRNRP